MSENEENKQEKEDLSLLEKSLKSRRILLSEDVNSKSAKKIIDRLFLLETENPDKPIYFFINSPGGEVNSGLAIYDVMEFIKCPVYTIGCGLVASIAAIIHLQPQKEMRLSLPHAEYLLHQPLGQMQGSASELEIHAKQILKTRAELNLLISDKTGHKLDVVAENTKRDFWMDAQESMEWGLVGKIVRSSSDLPEK
tara:strand:+ start:824 stop:1411 length:588 start_codon:yes stop_codon:yes gene_type:complete